MKKLFTVMMLLLALQASSQEIDSVTLSQLKLNFAVPDIPAFKSLGSEPSDLLKPSTPKALALSMSEFYSNKTLIIPNSFAMELSPSLLVHAQSTQLAKYAKHAAWYSFRVSVGSSTDTSLSKSGRNLSLGFRITPIDKSDPVRDVDFLNAISEHLKVYRLTERSLRAEFVKANINDIKKVIDEETLKQFDLTNDLDLGEVFRTLQKADAKWTKAYDDFVIDKNTKKQNDDGVAFDKWLENEKNNRKKYKWNATKLDIAAALLTSSADSLVKNVQFNKLQAWVTYAQPVGKKAQLMIGLNGSTYKNVMDRADSTKNNMYWNMSLPLRFLFGTNRIKGFIELQDKYQTNLNSSTNNVLVQLGSELNIIDGFWINLNGGVQNNTVNGSSSFVANMNLKFTIPEKFKFF